MSDGLGESGGHGVIGCSQCGRNEVSKFGLGQAVNSFIDHIVFGEV